MTFSGGGTPKQLAARAFFRDLSRVNPTFDRFANESIDFDYKLRPDSSFSQADLDKFNRRQDEARQQFATQYGSENLRDITRYDRLEDIPRYTQEEIRQMNIEALKANPKSKFNRDKLPKKETIFDRPNQKVPQAVVDSYNSLIGKFRNLRDTGDQSAVGRQDFQNVLNSLRDSPAEYIQPGEKYLGPAFENVDGSLLRDDPDSIFFRIKDDIESGRGNTINAQKEIGQLVKSGSISKENAIQLSARLQPTFEANPFKQKVLNDTELAEVRADLEARRPIEISKLSSAVNQGGVSDFEADEYRKDIRKSQGRTEKTFTPKAYEDILRRASTNGATESFKSKLPQLNKEPFAERSGDQTGTEKAQQTSNFNRQDFNNTIDALKESKASTASTRDAFNTELSRATGPSSKVVNRPETRPTATTNNVTKPTGNSSFEKKQAGIANDPFLSNKEKKDLQFNLAADEYGPKFDRKQFNFLLDRLTGSKIRQNRDTQSQERQNIYSRGLSSMFANF